ncbi:hypothetical protein ACOMHN_017601 [Nucella lapillus]
MSGGWRGKAALASSDCPLEETLPCTVLCEETGDVARNGYHRDCPLEETLPCTVLCEETGDVARNGYHRGV